MPSIASRRHAAACLLIAFIPSAALAESEVLALHDENGIEMYSNIEPMPTALLGGSDIVASGIRSTTRLASDQSGQLQKDSDYGSFTPEHAAPNADNLIHELQDPQAPQDH